MTCDSKSQVALDSVYALVKRVERLEKRLPRYGNEFSDVRVENLVLRQALVEIKNVIQLTLGETE